jgi:hypothetical protein
MHRVLFTQSAAQWYPPAKGLQGALKGILLTLALAACLTVLAYRSSSFALLGLAQSVSAIGAVMHAIVVLMLARLIVRAGGVWRRLQKEGKRTTELRQLCRVILGAIGTTVLMALLTVAAACAPLAIKGVMQVPECGLIFIFMIVAIALHGANINRTCGLVSDSVLAAHRASKHTTAA